MTIQADEVTIRANEGRSLVSPRAAVLAYLVVCGLVLLLMMLLGLTMRLAQAQWITVPPNFFYVVMTMHGAGMVGITGLAGAAVMWHFVRRYVPVSTAVFVANLVFFIIGAAFILGAGFHRRIRRRLGPSCSRYPHTPANCGRLTRRLRT